MTIASTAWYRTATPQQWKVLWAAMLGWLLDSMDVMLYAFALTAIQREFHFSGAESGELASATLFGYSLGGFGFGYVADRFGRVRALIFSILAYSLFTGATALAHSAAALVTCRFLVGLGLGGEWTAGSVLVAEVWAAKHRGQAIGIVQSGWALGYIAAALLSAAILPKHGWRALFFVGVFPALFTLWVRRSVSEPEIWSSARAKSAPATSAVATIFRPPLLRNTLLVTLLSSLLMFAYWGLFTWLPTYLATPVSRGGAGMSIVQSTSWIIPMQVGAFVGYLVFGFLSDRFGRRPTFLLFVLDAAACVPIYALHASSAATLMILGPLLGFFGHGYFSVFGTILAELFPSAVRGVSQGFCYNAGRGVSVFAPATIGFMADRNGIGVAIACTSLLYVLAAGVIYFLPETKGTSLS